MKQKRAYSRNWKWGVGFILFWLAGFLLLQAYPLARSLYLSFTDYSILKPGKWVGLDNYIRLFTKDRYFWKALRLTLLFTLISVPMKIIFALFVAMLLNMKTRGINFFRTVYYLPSIMGGSVAVSILWRFMFMREGIVNRFLALLGLNGVDWLGNPSMALFTVSLLVVWQFGSSMVLFLGALKNVPTELYEAASVDGATKIRQFFTITIPMISPIIFFNMIMQTIMALQEFTAVSIITNGGPNHGTYLLGLKIYEDGFGSSKMGYACATSWILFLIILIVTLVFFKFSDSWVFYSDGGRDK